VKIFLFAWILISENYYFYWRVAELALNISNLLMRLPPPFDFRSTAYSHGWVMLAPNNWDNETETIERVLRLDSGIVLHLKIWATGTMANPGIRIQVTHQEALTRVEITAIKRALGRMLRTAENFDRFYAFCLEKGDPWSQLISGIGRLLRSPTLFEDIVKTICTTNIHWGGTKSMVGNLVASLGDPFPGDPNLRAFPTPQAIAAADPTLLTQARLGYRAPYIHTVAQQVVSGELDLSKFEDPELPTAVVREMLLAIKGVGNYAAHTLLMLLGRYEHLAFDTAMRDFVGRKYFSGRQPTEEEAFEIYHEWQDWKYLAYWFDIWSDEPDA
jgi:3-methyladenine DNA glycosylase/8-oxoguanine DNA glycosylase